MQIKQLLIKQKSLRIQLIGQPKKMLKLRKILINRKLRPKLQRYPKRKLRRSELSLMPKIKKIKARQVHV